MQKINRQIPHVHQFVSELLEVFESYRLLQTILFLTDSIFYVLFAYFDESMSSIGGHEPWRSWNTVDITPILIYNEFTTVPKVVIYFLILMELRSFLLCFVL